MDFDFLKFINVIIQKTFKYYPPTHIPMQDKIFDMLLNQDDITWKSIILDAVKKGEMDPWNINVSLLAKKYLDVIRELKEINFRLTGKIVLAATLLLKIKSNKLVGDDISNLDDLFAQARQSDEDDFFEESEFSSVERDTFDYKLIPRVPQPRKRKVSVYDLMNALQKAMEVKNRQITRNLPASLRFEVPTKKFNMSQLSREIFSKVRAFFIRKKNESLTYSRLLPENPTKRDKVYAFIPLLHLANQRKIDISQQEHFGEIEIKMPQKQ